MLSKIGAGIVVVAVAAMCIESAIFFLKSIIESAALRKRIAKDICIWECVRHVVDGAGNLIGKAIPSIRFVVNRRKAVA